MAPLSIDSDFMKVTTCCFNCGKPKSQDVILKLCGHCHVHNYCSIPCQDEFWGLHQASCKLEDEVPPPKKAELRHAIETFIRNGCIPNIKQFYAVFYVNKKLEVVDHTYYFRNDLSEEKFTSMPEHARSSKKELTELFKKHPEKAIVEVVQLPDDEHTFPSIIGNFVFSIQNA